MRIDFLHTWCCRDGFVLVVDRYSVYDWPIGCTDVYSRVFLSIVRVHDQLFRLL